MSSGHCPWRAGCLCGGRLGLLPCGLCARSLSGVSRRKPIFSKCGQKVSWAPGFNLMALETQYDLFCRGNELLMKTCKQGPSLGWATEGMPVSQGSWPLHPHSPAWLATGEREGALGEPRGGAPDEPNAPGDRALAQSQAGEERKQQTGQSKAAALGRVGDARKVDSGRQRATPVMFYYPDSGVEPALHKEQADVAEGQKDSPWGQLEDPKCPGKGNASVSKAKEGKQTC